MNILLIWDIDGTLIQGRGLGRRAMDKAFSEVYGIHNALNTIDMRGRLDAVIMKEAFEAYKLPGEAGEEYIDCYCRHLSKAVAELPASIEAPGILPLLKRLSQIPYIYQVLGTGNYEKAARIKLEPYGMNPYFPTGGFGDAVMERWQVIEEAIVKAQDHFGVTFEKHHIFVIGDTPKDIECGLKLGIKSVGLGTGGYSITELVECRADYTFEDLSQPEAFLRILR